MKQSEGPLAVLTEAPPPQVFYPKDSYSHPVQLDLLFRQVRASSLSASVTPRGNGHVDWLSADSASALRAGLPDAVWMGSCSAAPLFPRLGSQAHLTRPVVCLRWTDPLYR